VNPYVLSQFRHRSGRAFGVVLGIALGAALYLALTMLGGAFNLAAVLPLKGVAADLVLTRPATGAATEAPLQKTRGPRLPFGNSIFTAGEALLIAGEPGVTTSSGALEIWDFGDSNYRVVLGIDPSQTLVGPLAGLKTGLLSGRLLEAGDGEVAVADRHFAAFYGLKPGDSIQLGGKAFRIVGIAEQKQSSQAGVANLYIPISVAEGLVGLRDGEVNQVYVGLSDASRSDAVVKALTARLGPLSAVSQESILEVMGGVSRVTARFASLGAALGAIGGLALAWAALSGLMAERRREIGIMKAVGWKSRDILRSFVLESTMLGTLGGILGIAIGIIIAYSFASLPLPTQAMQPNLPGLAAVPLPAASLNLPVELSPAAIFAAFLIAVVGGTATGWIGAKRATRLGTARVLRDE